MGVCRNCLGGGGNFLGVCASCMPRAKGVRGHSPQELFLNDAIWCALEHILKNFLTEKQF